MEEKTAKKPKYEKPIAIDLKTTIVNGGVIDTNCDTFGLPNVPTSCPKGPEILWGG
jgi:hypothetical protein